MLAGAGVALRYEYRQPLFSLSDSIREQQDNILIGTRKDLQTRFPNNPVRQSGAAITVEPAVMTSRETGIRTGDTEIDRAHARITLSGDSPEEMDTLQEQARGIVGERPVDYLEASSGSIAATALRRSDISTLNVRQAASVVIASTPIPRR